MKIFAWLLAVLAVTGSVALGANWWSARRNGTQAVAAVEKFTDDLATWQHVAVMRHNHLISQVENDDLEIRNDQLRVEIAELEGRGAATARQKLYGDRIRRGADEMTRSVEFSLEELGPDSNVVEAQERLKASQDSLAVYTQIVARDRSLLYAVGAVWLAFGFAAALAVEMSKRGRPSASMPQ